MDSGLRSQLRTPRLERAVAVARSSAGTETGAAARLLADEVERLLRALEMIDEPYPVEVFPDLQKRDSVFAAMREANRYATEQFWAECARQRARVVREWLEHDRAEADSG